MHTILAVDDELSVRESFSVIFEGKYEILLAASGEAALKTIADHQVDLTYLDIRMPGLDGLETLKRIKEINPDQEVIMVTAVNDIKKAGEAVRLGARDYLVKPFDVNELQKLTEEILRKKGLLLESKEIRGAAVKTLELSGLEELEKTIEEVASKDMPVLILGEAGTEKEALASLIHKKSSRRASPFIGFELLPHLPESEFFGETSGASTVELSKKAGLAEKAKGGTLFLNHAERLSAAVLQNLAQTEVRLIAAASPDLEEKNKEVYDFFGETVLVLPALRARRIVIANLVAHHLDILNQKHGKQVKISPEALEILNTYNWPGNVQELEALLEKMVLAGKDLITPAALPLNLLLQGGSSLGADFLSAFEKQYIQKIVKESGGNREEAAALLGIKPSALLLFLSS